MAPAGPPWPARVLRALAAPLAGIRYAWSRSIQARVVLSVLLLSALVITLVGVLLMRQVSSGLTESKRQQSVNEGVAGVQNAQETLNSEPVANSGSQSLLLPPLLDALISRGGTPRTYQIVLTGPVLTRSGAAGAVTVSSIGLSADSIPNSLRAQVLSSQQVSWTYTTMTYAATAESVPAVAVGSQIKLTSTGDVYALYYLFPMGDQQSTLSLVGRALFSAGLLLMVLVAAVAWLVTRQVVTPVRLARRIAERLAAGRLEERMHVRGEDDIARLGTSFNKMAASLQQQIRQLEELSRMQQRFVSDVSHELRTPLTTVRMAADLLHDARDRFDPVTGRAAELLQNELDRFQALLTDLLEISRFDAGAARLELETINLTAVAHRVAGAYSALAERAGVELRVVEGAGPTSVQADVRRIERVARNLVANAIGYSGSRRVEIRVAGDEGAVSLVVRDWGIGLKPGESTLVFNRFWRADPARARSGGTGLGLAISLEDAQLHGGWLQAWGAPGQGTAFRLTLPRRCGDDLQRSPLPLVPQDEPPSVVGAPYARLDRLGSEA